MEITDFIWLPQVEDKIEIKHNVTREEVEEVFDHQSNDGRRVSIRAKMDIVR
jgi:hypothetical protein